MRILPLSGALLALAGTCRAGGEYESLLAEAERVYRDRSGRTTLAERIDFAYATLARAAQLDPARWEAFFERGLNRCRAALFGRAKLEDVLDHARAAGLSADELRRQQEGGERWIENRLVEARREFQIGFQRMRAAGIRDSERVLFANAALKVAARHYLAGRRGEPGAIADLKKLIHDGFEREACAEQIALCYLELGDEAYASQQYADARAQWKRGLEWCTRPGLKRILLTNIAGAHDMDGEFGAAEEVLHELVRLEPDEPGHWKNLGLMAGYQSRLKEALYYFRRARDLCGDPEDPGFAGLQHGNAWLRAAIIHGKLLERDGDVRQAWELFFEYRRMFGDDYNFSLWFGDFLADAGRYDLAWKFLARARELQPFCPLAYQSLVRIAPRLPGTREEVRARMQAAERALDAARAHYDTRVETPAVQRICNGTHDLADGGAPPSFGSRLDPDPLAGLSGSAPPPWIERIAAEREPFVPWAPGSAEAGPPALDTPPSGPAAPPPDWGPLVVPAAVLAGAGILAVVLIARRRKAANVHGGRDR